MNGFSFDNCVVGSINGPNNGNITTVYSRGPKPRDASPERKSEKLVLVIGTVVETSQIQLALKKKKSVTRKEEKILKKVESDDGSIRKILVGEADGWNKVDWKDLHSIYICDVYNWI